jgi:GTP-binding protein YchF
VQVGIIGLKSTGKTTLYNAITGAGAPTGQGGVEPHRAIGQVPDPRLDWLTALHKPTREVHAQIEWVDVPGFAPASYGVSPSEPASAVVANSGREATRFLEYARKANALAQVVRCFDNGYGRPDPAGEITTLAVELILADLQIVENRLERLAKERQKMGRLAQPLEETLMQRLCRQLEDGAPLRRLEFNSDELRILSGYSFLTLKPLIFVLNLAENAPAPEDAIREALAAGGEVIPLCARLEAELAELMALDPTEAAAFLTDLGIAEPALGRMIHAAYRALALISFFTVGQDECRAWMVRKDSRAPQAASVIHSDMERGFIRAVVVAYEDLRRAGDMAAAKKANRVREEGKNYIVQDGDIIEIRFNV